MSDSTLNCRRCGAPKASTLRGTLCAACRLESVLPPGVDLASPTASDFPQDTRPLVQQCGPYELLEEIGRGGMGVIYKARQIGLDRLVALKMLIAGEFADSRAREQLTREARIASRLSHPGIVTIFDVGEHQGHPYFAMEYVPGRNMSQLCREGLLPLNTAASYVEQLARAVQYAHQHGVIHRDLKPANVLITPDNNPKLTDFGLTKSVVDQTRSLESGGSPNFMAPEQAHPKLGKTGTQTDVFGLGGILYYLLTGLPPAVGETLAETLRRVVDTEPVPPTTIRPGVPRDLETIALKCLEKDPARRYHSALEVAEELDRWLTHEPILARPATAVERLGKLVRRHPLVSGLTTICLVLGLLGVSGIAWQARRARAEAESVLRVNYGSTLERIRQLLDEGVYETAQTELHRLPERFRGWEWGHLAARAHRALLTTTILTNPTTSGPVFPKVFAPKCLQVSPDNEWMAVSSGGMLDVVQTRTGRVQQFVDPESNPIQAMAFSPDGHRLVTAGPGDGFTLWHCDALRPLQHFGREATRPRSVEFSRDGTQILTVDAEVGVRLWNASTLAAERIYADATSDWKRARFDTEGHRILALQDDPLVGTRFLIWEKDTGHLVASGPPPGGKYTSVELNHDGRRFATVSTNGVASAWNTGDSKPFFSTPAEGPNVSWAAVAEDHPRLFTQRGKASEARFWNTETGEALPSPAVSAAHPSVGSDGKTLISTTDTRMHVWDWIQGKPREQFGLGDVAIEFVADVGSNGRLLAALCNPYPAPRLLHAWVLPRPGLAMDPPIETTWISMSPRGDAIAVGESDGRISLWNSRSGSQEGWLTGHFLAINDLEWTQNGEELLSASSDLTVRRWNPARRQSTQVYRDLRRPVYALSLTPNGHRIAAVDVSGAVCLWDGETGTVLRRLQLKYDRHQILMPNIALSTDGRHLCLTGNDDAGVWSVETGNKEIQFDPAGTSDAYHVMIAAFNQDGSRLVASGRNGSLRLYNTRSWQVIGVNHSSDGATSLAFSGDGDRILVATAQVTDPRMGFTTFEVADGTDLLPHLKVDRRPGTPVALDISMDGRRVFNAWLDATTTHPRAEIQEALPWLASEYPGTPTEPLSSRIAAFARNREIDRLFQPQPVSTFQRSPAPPESRDHWIPRAPGTPSECLDLTPNYNGHLETGWLPELRPMAMGNDLAGLPQGTIQLDGITWDVRGVIATTYPDVLPVGKDPLRTPTLPVRVGSTAFRIHFLHTATHSPPQGGAVGSYRIHYADGDVQTLPLVAGQNIAYFWSIHRQSKGSATRIAWEGENDVAFRRGSRVGIHHFAWDNPHPEKRIESLEVIGVPEVGSLALIAVTLER